MRDLRNLKDEDLQGLTPEAVTALALRECPVFPVA